MTKLENTFTRAAFQYTLLKRDGDAALFSKVLTNKADSPTWFEVIKVCKDGEGNEAFPPATSWDVLGKLTKDEAQAQTWYDEFVAEYGEEAQKEDSSPLVTETPDRVELAAESEVGDAEDAALSNQVSQALATKAPSGKTRGRKKADVNLTIPDTGTFQARELAAQIDMSVPFVHNRLKAMIKEGSIEIHDTVKGRRGKPIILFKKKGATV